MMIITTLRPIVIITNRTMLTIINSMLIITRNLPQALRPLITRAFHGPTCVHVLAVDRKKKAPGGVDKYES